ncbi:MAG TPA: alanine--tRNA ligase, partial [Chloroflexi bacterium]|nr:alanine--tRNA ligase [Chloroflexota bacterium]
MSVPTTSDEIRQTFLDFFHELGHEIVPSSSLVPAGDPTLLFTNAGMNQFKDVFLGLEERPYTRAATAQKCMRVSGKHNDLENVGPSPRHHTFFEMLGNFSFGDYFKEQAIAYAWTLLTEVFKLQKERLWATIYEDDDEAFELWKKHIAEERILRFGKKDNFWEMGDTGPCGPSSEIHYYIGPLEEQRAEGVNSEDDNYVEVWNLVFMQFDRDASGVMTPLPKPSIDTGMGFERITMVMQGVESTYETDIFRPILARIQEVAGHRDAEREAHKVAYRVIADHIRAASFLVADGVVPGNEGRSYVLRLILRRAMRFGKRAGITRPFVHDVAEAVIERYGDHYTELRERRDFILQALGQEEERFQQTLETGLALLDELLDRLAAAEQRVVPGEEAFRLYDTYGFPYDLTRDVAEERGFTVDRSGFDRAMAEQKARARAAQKFDADSWIRTYRDLELPPTVFVGYEYDHLVDEPTQIVALIRDGQRVESVGAGEDVEVILSRTPFYAEGGGQVADTGTIDTEYGRITIGDVRQPRGGLWVHFGTVAEGMVRQGEMARATVDVERRWNTMRNHTATHLLHRALRNVLGEHAEQRGSLVAPDYLRFDFAHLTAVTPQEIDHIQNQVNEHIRADHPVIWRVMPLEEALASGATALFGEKYGGSARVVSIEYEPGPGAYSRELCGGTHVTRTGQIGPFIVTQEGSIASGIRRITALTGEGAESFIQEHLNAWRELATQLGTPTDRLPERVGQLQQQLAQQEKTIKTLERRLAQQQLQALLGQAQHVDGFDLVAAQVEAPSNETLRELSLQLRDRLGSAVVVLGALIGDKPSIVATATPDVVARGVHAGALAREVAQRMGGGGG